MLHDLFTGPACTHNFMEWIQVSLMESLTFSSPDRHALIHAMLVPCCLFNPLLQDKHAIQRYTTGHDLHLCGSCNYPDPWKSRHATLILSVVEKCCLLHTTPMTSH